MAPGLRQSINYTATPWTEHLWHMELGRSVTVVSNRSTLSIPDAWTVLLVNKSD